VLNKNGKSTRCEKTDKQTDITRLADTLPCIGQTVKLSANKTKLFSALQPRTSSQMQRILLSCLLKHFTPQIQ